MCNTSQLGETGKPTVIQNVRSRLVMRKRQVSNFSNFSSLGSSLHPII